MLAMMYSVLPVMMLAWYLYNMWLDATTVTEQPVHIKEQAPILYPMVDEAGNYIKYDVDISDWQVDMQVKKTCDIIQGQYWVEVMQMMDIQRATDQVLGGY